MVLDIVRLGFLARLGCLKMHNVMLGCVRGKEDLLPRDSWCGSRGTPGPSSS